MLGIFYPVQGELGSDPCAHVFVVKLSDTESKFKYKDGFFTDSGCKKTEHKLMIETEGNKLYNKKTTNIG